MTGTEATLFWGFLVVYGVVMYALSPKSRNPAFFYKGADDQGRPMGQWSLTASIFISWIFAKSVTNRANLGAAYGVTGGWPDARWRSTRSGDDRRPHLPAALPLPPGITRPCRKC